MVFGPKLGEDQKKGLQSDFVRFCAQTFCPSHKRGAMPQCYMLFFANYTILAIQRHHGLPLNTPLGADTSVPKRKATVPWPSPQTLNMKRDKAKPSSSKRMYVITG